MGFFTRTAMDMLMKTTHPEINRRQCWNLHPHRKPCTECKDICPYGEQIFTRPNLVKDWDPCTECGLCVSACRSGCIIPTPEQVQRDTSAADTDNDTIWIGCEKSTRKNSMVRTCISALTWETLAYLALNKKIVLDLTPCGECENDLCAAQLRKELTRLVDFFGQPMFEARFTLAYEPDEALYHVKELSRREMFEQVSHGSKSGTKKLLQMLPGLHSEDDGGVDFRLLLHQRTKQLKASMETPLKYGYYLPNFTDKCFGCGKCEKACRAGALKLEDLPDGQTRIVITPWKCSECGVCVAACSNTNAPRPCARNAASPLRRAVWMVCAPCAASRPAPKSGRKKPLPRQSSCVRSAKPKRLQRKPPRQQPKPVPTLLRQLYRRLPPPQKPLRPVP